MNRNTKKTLSVLLYFIAVMTLSVYFVMELKINTVMSIYTRMALILVICVSWYNAGRLHSSLCDRQKADKVMRFNFTGLFVLYVMLLLTLTLFDEFFGRSGIASFPWNKELLIDYLEESFNFVPFATILLYFRALINSDISFSVFAVNIFGNIIAFMPFGFFLPLLIKPLKVYKNFILAVLAITMLIEFMQFVFMTGSCDIDDIILNTLGASLSFLFFSRYKRIKKPGRIF